jgi:iron complex transport system substrate-binding protein
MKHILLDLSSLLLLVFTLGNAARAEIAVTDMLGREVALAAPARRIFLPEGRHILTLGLVAPDPVSLVVGWGDDLKRYSPATWKQLTDADPRAADIPVISSQNHGDFPYEAVIAARPDLVIFTLYSPPPVGLERLDAAHIPYVFTDFFHKPLEKTVPSLRILGRLLGYEGRTESFISLYDTHMQRIADGLAGAKRPDVFFHLNPDGNECCYSSGPGNMSDFIGAAGGHNIGANKIPGPIGRLDPEYILTQRPAYYIAGGGSSVAVTGLKVGPSVDAETARRSLDRVLSNPYLLPLDAVKQERAHGIWLFFFDNPLFLVGVEEMAKIFHPDLFPDLEPQATLDQITREFLPFPLSGTFWIGVEPAR